MKIQSSRLLEASQKMACLKLKFIHGGIFRLRAKANSVLCVQCGKWLHSRFSEMKKVTPKFSRIFLAGCLQGMSERQRRMKKGYASK